MPRKAQAVQQSPGATQARRGTKPPAINNPEDLASLALKACLIARDAAFNVHDLLTNSSRMAFLAIKDCEKELDLIERQIDERLPEAITRVNESRARQLLSTLKSTTDLERVGDLAINIAEAASRYLAHAPVKELVDIPRMANIAQGMLRDALDSFVRRDINLAQRVLDQDDDLDALKTQVFRDLLAFMLKDPQTIEPSLDLILISRHLERIGDHATNIAEDVIYMVSAKDVRHHAQ